MQSARTGAPPLTRIVSLLPSATEIACALGFGDALVGRSHECDRRLSLYRPDHPGFSHTHFSGAGHSDLGDVLVMPVAGDAVPLGPGDAKVPGSGYRSRFDHATECAELIAGTRVGVHRYAFPKERAAHLVLDLRTSLYEYPGKILWSSVRLRPDGTIAGARQTRGWAPDRDLDGEPGGFDAIRARTPAARPARGGRRAA